MFGLEIEFITDKAKLFEALRLNDIPYVYYNQMKTPKHDIIVLKKESTLKDSNGIEINFPPCGDFAFIERVLTILNQLDVIFNARCALHVHVGVDDAAKLRRIHTYYCDHQEEIISQASHLYVNLNRPTLLSDNYLTGKCRNINVYNAYKNHQTVEHRIYKATIDIDEVKFCINQTLQIIEAALNETPGGQENEISNY